MTTRNAYTRRAAAMGILTAGVIVALLYWLPAVSRGPVGVLVGSGEGVVTPTPTPQLRGTR